MKNFSKFLLLLAFIFNLSCTDNPVEDKHLSGEFEKLVLLDNFQIPTKDLESLKILGFEGSSGIVVERINNINNTSFIAYLMEGDIEIRKDSLNSMVNELQRYTPSQNKQYRTTNLVNTPKNVHVIGMNITNSTLREGLTRAIANYNELNIRLSFSLEFRSVKTINESVAASNDSDILAKQLGTDPGGSAGFPSGGNPYPSLYVSQATASYGINVTTHVFTHEIGHAIGLRHTDYFDRSLSCGGNYSNEGSGDVGAFHIPGTPATTSIDFSSVMLACFDSFESGAFSNFDITALEYLY